MSEYSVPDYGRIRETKVYGLDESIRRAKFPMSTDVAGIVSSDEIGFWLKDDFLPGFIEHIDSGKYPRFVIKDDHAEMHLKKVDSDDAIILIDEEDIPSIFPYDWHYDSYCRSNKVGLLHRFLMKDAIGDDDTLVIDHINGDTSDNRKSNLRLASRSQNSFNAAKRKNNTSGIMGVSWKADKNKWKAYITPKGKQIHLGYYDSFNDAVIARLEKEREVCGSFAPQRDLFEESPMLLLHIRTQLG